MSRVKDGLTGEGENLVANRGQKCPCIPAWQVGSPDRTREHAVPHERDVVPFEYDPAW
jgi:hypothetical protein